nr:hypothetical protein [Tanacetum cinerariifolium]
MANVPLNDPNIDAPAIVPAPDAEEEEEDPKEYPEEEPKDDDDMEMDDETKVIDPYMDDGSNNLPPLNSEDEETPPTSPVIPDADGQPIALIASFGQNFHFGKSSSTANLLTRNSNIVPTGPMCPNLGTVWKRLGKMEKFMSERIDTKGRIKKKFKEQDRHFLGLGCDNIEMDKTMRNVMSAKRVLEKEFVNERNGKKFYREFDEYMCRMLQNRQKSEGSFPLPLGSQVREPPAEPSARIVIEMDKTMRNVMSGLSGLKKKSTRGNPSPPLTQDTVNRMIQETIKAAIRAERERVQNEENRAEGPNDAPVARECTFADFMKCSPI